MTYEFVKTERRGNVLVVTMNRPEVYNAVHPPMQHEMAAIWDAFSSDPEMWVAILTGAGTKAFSAGNDLKYAAKGGGVTLPPTGFGGLSKRFDLEKPIIAAVNGFAMGGGFETALACDIIIAAETATFALPEVKVGFLAATGGVQRLSRYIGRLAAQELLYTGRHVGAEEALKLGLVNAVVPQADLIAAAMAKAEEIASVSPSAVKATKRVMNAMARDEHLPESLDYSLEVVADLAKTEDFREGVNAFVEKRKPIWVNR
jgi:enoyl-CoA hydratase/carnithine racemase